MSKLFSRQAITLVWLIVGFGLFAALAPVSLATGVLLLLVWGMVPLTMFILWRKPSPTMGEVLRQVEKSPSERER